MKAAAPGSMAEMRITVVYSPAPRSVVSRDVRLPAGCTAAQALQASGLLQDFPGLDPASEGGALSVWGRRCDPAQVLQDLDRVELCRPLKVDPKVARRARFAQQGARATGLFARRRPGAKPGY